MSDINVGLAVISGLATGLAVWLAMAPVDVRRRLRPMTATLSRRPRRLETWPAVVAAAVGVMVGSWGGAGPGLASGFVAATVLWLVRGHLRHRGAEKSEEAVVAACRALAGLLRVGHIPSVAVRTVAAESQVLAEVSAVQSVGGEIAPVLRRLGAAPGQGGLVELANAWQVTQRTGASLTATLDALAERLVAQEAVQQTVRAELAGPRSTGRLLAALPAAGVALGFFMGGDPIGFLTESWLGQVLLVVGVGLACVGVVWTERIADAYQ